MFQVLIELVYIYCDQANLSEKSYWLLAKRLWISNIAVKYLHKVIDRQYLSIP